MMKKRDVALSLAALVSVLIFWRQFSSGRGRAKQLSTGPNEFAFAGRTALSFIRQPPNGQQEFTISQIVNLCHLGKEWTIDKKSVISSSAALNETKIDLSAQRTAYLGDCRPLEIAVHQDARSMGLCSDYAQYILYADARLNPEFDEETYKTKLLLCPKTIHLHFEAVRKVFFSNTSTHENWWAPNIEQISKDDVTAFLRTSKYLCKTKITCTAIEKYLAANNLLLSQRNNDDEDDDEEHIRVQQKNSDLEYAHLPGQQLVYMSHSSIDVLEDSQQVLGAKRFAEIKQDFNQFLHVQGKSGRKHTREMYNCWKEHNDWPKLTIIGNQNKTKYETDLPTIGPMPDNIQVFTHLNVEELRSIQASIGIHVCPSSQEGYGHYINEARSLGALVLTTDYPPMNEFVKDAVSGILIGHDPPAAEEYQLLTPQFISPVHVEPKHICDAVARVLKDFDVSKRREMGRKAREAFEYDTYLMQTNMVQLKEEAYTHLNGR